MALKRCYEFQKRFEKATLLSKASFKITENAVYNLVNVWKKHEKAK